MSVRPSRVRFSQPPGSDTTEVEQSTERRISESGEVKGVCPESAPLAPRDMILENEPILSNRAQAKRKMRYRRAWTVTPGSQTASSRSTTLEQPGVRRVSWKPRQWKKCLDSECRTEEPYRKKTFVRFREGLGNNW
jgi:hypothetical protein